MTFVDEHIQNVEILNSLEFLRVDIEVENYPKLPAIEKIFHEIQVLTQKLNSIFNVNSILAIQLTEIRSYLHQIEEQFNGIYSILCTPIIDDLLLLFNAVRTKINMVVKSKAIKLYIDMDNDGRTRETDYPTYFLDENALFEIIKILKPHLQKRYTPSTYETDISTFFNSLLKIISISFKVVTPNQFYIKKCQVMAIWECLSKDIDAKKLSLQKFEYFRNSKVLLTQAINTVDAFLNAGEINPERKIKIQGVFGFRDEVKPIATFIEYLRSYDLNQVSE